MSGTSSTSKARTRESRSATIRVRLLSLMLASPGMQACTYDLTEPLGLTQPTITHHLRKLAAAGLIVPERRVGNFTYYRVVSDALAGLAGILAPPTMARTTTPESLS
jgi:ArsR family transcriptional regulator